MAYTSQCLNRSDIQGPFTPILYRGKFADGIERVTFLDRERNRTVIKPFAPEFEYTVTPHLLGRAAVERAELFISQHYAFLSPDIAGIIEEAGTLAGYEIRPYNDPLIFGQQDILEISYTEDDTLITARIRLMPCVERMLAGS